MKILFDDNKLKNETLVLVISGYGNLDGSFEIYGDGYDISYLSYEDIIENWKNR